MEQVQLFINRLVEEYKYKPLPIEKSRLARAWFEKKFQKYFGDCTPDMGVYTPEGLQIATSYTCVVTGDYGTYIEIAPEQMILENIEVEKGQEFRLEKWFSGKYIWYAPKECTGKIYHQLRGVKYADYREGMYYISPYEVLITHSVGWWNI